MKKVVASLVLASLVSSSAVAVDVIGAFRSTTANVATYLKSNPKTVALSAAGILVVGSALTAYQYPEGRTRSLVNKLNPRRLFSSEASASEDQDQGK